jgi:hypothetical protein
LQILQYVNQLPLQVWLELQWLLQRLALQGASRLLLVLHQLLLCQVAHARWWS